MEPLKKEQKDEDKILDLIDYAAVIELDKMRGVPELKEVSLENRECYGCLPPILSIEE